MSREDFDGVTHRDAGGLVLRDAEHVAIWVSELGDENAGRGRPDSRFVLRQAGHGDEVNSEELAQLASLHPRAARHAR